jgi:hypothetical protein
VLGGGIAPVLPEIGVPARLGGGVEPPGGVPTAEIGPEEFADEVEPEVPVGGPPMEAVGAAPAGFKEPDGDRPDGVEATVPGGLDST